VIEGTELPCVYDIPDHPEGEDLNTEEVNVLYTAPGSEAVTLPRVASLSDCGANQGWYYDDPAEPTQIIVCPATCDLFAATDEAQVDFQFGCATVVL
jgi:hypothetical protein